MSLIPCRVAHLIIDQQAEGHNLICKEINGHRQLLIAIGGPEALAIERALAASDFPRPLTHDLTSIIIVALGGRLDAVVIDACHEGTYHAHLVVMAIGEQEKHIDARPSDAVALALRSSGCALFISEELLQDPTNPTSNADSTTDEDSD